MEIFLHLHRPHSLNSNESKENQDGSSTIQIFFLTRNLPSHHVILPVLAAHPSSNKSDLSPPAPWKQHPVRQLKTRSRHQSALNHHP